MNTYRKFGGEFKPSRSSFIIIFISEMKHEFVYHIMHMINHNTTEFLEAYNFSRLFMDFVDGEPRFLLKLLDIMPVHKKYSSSRVTSNINPQRPL